MKWDIQLKLEIKYMLKLMDFYLLSKNIVKNISKNISKKCSQNLLNNAKQSDLIENTFADKITGHHQKVFQGLPQEKQRV